MTTLDCANFPPLGDQAMKHPNPLPLTYRFPASPVLGHVDCDGSRDESTSPQPEAYNTTPFIQHNPAPARREETADTADNLPSIRTMSGTVGDSCQNAEVASTEAKCPAAGDTPPVAKDVDTGPTSIQEVLVPKDSAPPPQKLPLPSTRYSHSRKTPHHYKNHSRNHASRNYRSYSHSSSSMQHSPSGPPMYHSDHAGYYYPQQSAPQYPPPVPLTSNQPRFVLDEYGQPVTSLPVQVSVPVGLGLGSGTAYGPSFCGLPTSMGTAAATTPIPSANNNHVPTTTSPAPGADGTPVFPAPSPRFGTAHPGNDYADYYTGGYPQPYPHHPAAYSDVHRSEGYYYNAEAVYDAQTDIYGYYHSQSQAGHPHHMQANSPYPFRNMKSAGNANLGISGGTPASYHPNLYYSPTPPFANPTFAGQNITFPGTVLPANRGTQPYNSRGNRRGSKHSNNGYSSGTSTFNTTAGNWTTSRKNSTNSCGNGTATNDHSSTYLHESHLPLSPGNDIEISPEMENVCSDGVSSKRFVGPTPSATHQYEADMGNPNSTYGEDERSKNEKLSNAGVASNVEEAEPVTPSSSEFTDSYVATPANNSNLRVPTIPTAGGSGSSMYPMMRTKYPGTNVYIRGLPEDTTDEGLVDMCKIYGPIVSSKAILEHRTGACRGFGFVMYADFRQARAAISGLSFRGFQVSLAKCIPGAPSPRPYQNAPTYSSSLHLARPSINNLPTASSASNPNNNYMNHPYMSSSPRPPSPRYPVHIPTPQMPPAPSPMLQTELLLHPQETAYGHTDEQQPTVLLDPIPALNVVAGHFHPEREPEITVTNPSSTTTSLTCPIASFLPDASSTSILPSDNVLNNPILNDVGKNVNAVNTAQRLHVTETGHATLNAPMSGLKIHEMQEQIPPIVQQPRFTRPPPHYLPLPPCSSAPASATSTVPTGTPRFPHNQNQHEGIHGFRYTAYPTSPSASPRFGNNYQVQESFGTKLKNLQDINSTNLYMSNLPLDMNEVGLENLISPHPVISCRILCDTVMGSSRGVGFARMRDREAALAVIAALNGRILSGSKVPLKVRFSDSLAQKKLKTQTLKKKPFGTNGRGSQTYRRQSKQDDVGPLSNKSLSAPKSIDGNDDDNEQFNSGDECETAGSYVADEYPECAAAEETLEGLPADEEKSVPAVQQEMKESADVSSEKGQKPTMFFLAADGSVKPYAPCYATSASAHDEREEDISPRKSRHPESENDLEGQVERLAIR